MCRQFQRKVSCEVEEGEKCPIRKCFGFAFILVWQRPEQLLRHAGRNTKSEDLTMSNSGGVSTEFKDLPSGGSRFYGWGWGVGCHKFIRWLAQAYAGFYWLS